MSAICLHLWYQVSCLFTLIIETFFRFTNTVKSLCKDFPMTFKPLKLQFLFFQELKAIHNKNYLKKLKMWKAKMMSKKNNKNKKNGNNHLHPWTWVTEKLFIFHFLPNFLILCSKKLRILCLQENPSTKIKASRLPDHLTQK